MKTLVLVRHAKSSWDDPELQDIDRPLNKRGRRNAPEMAKRFAGLGLRADVLISSPAVRARTTAESFSSELGLSVQTDERIYEAGIQQLLETVRSIDDRHSAALLFGHNPGFSDFIRYLTEEPYADMPTAGIAVIELPLKSWKYVYEGKGILKTFLSPRRESIGTHQQTAPGLRLIDRIRMWRFGRAQRLEMIIAGIVGLITLLALILFLISSSYNPETLP